MSNSLGAEKRQVYYKSYVAISLEISNSTFSAFVCWGFSFNTEDISPIKLKSFQTNSFFPEPNSHQVPVHDILLTSLKQYMILENCLTAMNMDIQIVIEQHK